MGIGVSVVLLAAGAILIWAVNASVEGVNLDIVGVILIIVGAVGLLWSLIAAQTGEPRRRVVEE